MLRWKVVVGAVVILLSSGIGLLLIFGRGYQTREALVSDYLDALADRDENALKKLAAETVEEQKIETRLQTNGGYQVINLKVCYEEAKPQLTLVKITGKYQSEGKELDFSDQVSLVYKRGPFWLNYSGSWQLYL